jgi:hypothetical protein
VLLDDQVDAGRQRLDDPLDDRLLVGALRAQANELVVVCYLKREVHVFAARQIRRIDALGVGYPRASAQIASEPGRGRQVHVVAVPQSLDGEVPCGCAGAAARKRRGAVLPNRLVAAAVSRDELVELSLLIA